MKKTFRKILLETGAKAPWSIIGISSLGNTGSYVTLTTPSSIPKGPTFTPHVWVLDACILAEPRVRVVLNYSTPISQAQAMISGPCYDLVKQIWFRWSPGWLDIFLWKRA